MDMNRLLLHILSALVISAAFALPPQIFAQKKKTTTKTTAKAPKLSASELDNRKDEAFKNYRFDQAREYMEELGKLRQPEGIGDDVFLKQCELGENMLQRVENIAIIDSFTVDKDRFFEAYRLSAPSGRIMAGENLPVELAEVAPPQQITANSKAPVYVSEDGDMMIWSTGDCTTDSHIVTSHRLADDTWERPYQLSEAIDNFQEADWDELGYPFLMPDGTTLYFAADNTFESLGGYDIFVTRDNGNGFLEPQNIGMPYNSPYDDYMLAIDEVTGAGWWATDRNQIPDKVTIYVFVPQELRINYPVDAPDLIDRARITTIAGTGASTENNEKVLSAIKSLSNASTASAADFTFALPGGRVITRFDQLSNPAAVEAMKQYLDARFRLDRAIERLDDLRARYATDRSLKEKILSAESEIEQMRITLRRLSNNVVKADSRR